MRDDVVAFDDALPTDGQAPPFVVRRPPKFLSLAPMESHSYDTRVNYILEYVCRVSDRSRRSRRPTDRPSDRPTERTRRSRRVSVRAARSSRSVVTRIAATGTGAEKASFERNQLSPTTPPPRDPRADRPSVDAFERSPTARMGVAVPRARWALVAFVAFACGLFERARGEWTDVTDASSRRLGDSGVYGYAYSMRHHDGRYVVGYQAGTRVDFIPEREFTGAPDWVGPPTPATTAPYTSWGAAVDVGAYWMIVGEPAYASSFPNPVEGRAVIFEQATNGGNGVIQPGTVLTPSGERTSCGSQVRTVNNYALVKCANAGTDSTIHIFEFSSSQWAETQVIVTTGFDSIDMISQNTGTLFIAFGASGANTNGEVVIYKRDGSVIGTPNSWSELQNIPSPSNTAAVSDASVSFGANVHMHSDDIFVGAPNDDDGGLGSSVYVYTWSVSAGEYELADRLTVPSGYTIGTNGDIAGSNGLLAASYTTTSNELGIYVFKRDDSTGVWGDFLRIPQPDECRDGAFANFGNAPTNGAVGDGAIVLENVFLSVGCTRAQNSQLSPQPTYVPGNQPGSVLTYDVMTYTSSGSTGDGAATDAATDDDDDDLSKGEIAGIAIGCIAFAVIVLFICRRFICPRESPWTQKQPQQQPQVVVVRQQ